MSESLPITIMFPSKYICAADLDGKTATVTIEAVKPEMMRMKDNTQQKKYIVYFVGKEKALVLNKTNAYAIAEALHEKDAAKWVGCKVSIYPTTCSAFGATVDCIRVKEAK